MATSTTLSSQSYVFDPRPNYPLLLTAKRYWDPASRPDPDAATLICGHAAGFHKEHYEPMVQDMYALPGGRQRIREVWAVDAPNHGEAAVLNEEMLQWGYEPSFGWQDYGRALHAFVAGLGTGVDVDFSKRRLVFVGHSWSAVAFTLALTYQPPIKPDALVLLETMCVKNEPTRAMKNFLAGGAEKRRDIWASKEDAYKMFKSRPSWQKWDDRVLKLYAEYGLRSLPTLEYPDKHSGVTLTCSKRQEAAVYRDVMGSSIVYRTMKSIVKDIPVHVIWGAADDYIPRSDKDELIQSAMGGERNLASLNRVPGAGHLIAQTHPRECAQLLVDVVLKPKMEKARL
ncbi:unnamed protein product [Mycena citricolor]|uniref:AB hydrolase-1 domain-containing protein n=1 Tax=Mycena citricolor TaxID=2018698 RepID=A0AAD2K513_9AGAR|nr:unnamed protein product [Mycena citricolor]